MFKKLLLLAITLLIITLIVISCSAPTKMSYPLPSGGMPPPPPQKMCVGQKCRDMSAVDGGGTTRGNRDDSNDDKNN